MSKRGIRGVEGEVRRRRLSRAEGLALVEDLRRSGQTLSEFAQARGIPKQRVHYWRERAEARTPPERPAEMPATAFFALEAGAVAGAQGTQSVQRRELEIRVGDMLSIVLPADTPQPELVATLRGVLEAIAS